MKHVFVETNWVVAVAAPRYYRLASPEATELLLRAAKGEFTLELPSVCIAESRRAILTRFAPRQEADTIRRFIRWSAREGEMDESRRVETLATVSRMEAAIERDLAEVEKRLAQLRNERGLSIFHVGEMEAERCTELSFSNLNLEPFDQMILASILVRANKLREAGGGEMNFCELDSDLQPWGRGGKTKEPLTRLYDDAKVWVYGDFEMSTPRRPLNWLSSEA